MIGDLTPPLAAPLHLQGPQPPMSVAEQLVVRLEDRQALLALRHSRLSLLRQYDENFSQWLKEHVDDDELWLAACGLPPSLAWPFFACWQGQQPPPATCMLLLAEFGDVALDGRASVDERALVSAWHGDFAPLLSVAPSTNRAQLARLVHVAQSCGFGSYCRWAETRPVVELTDFYWVGAAAQKYELPALLDITERCLGEASAIRVAAGSCWTRALPWLTEQLQSMSVRGQAYLAIEALLGAELMLELLPAVVLQDEQPWLDDGTVHLLRRQINSRWLRRLPDQLLQGLPVCQQNLSLLRNEGFGWTRDIAAAQQWLRCPPLCWLPAARWQGLKRR